MAATRAKKTAIVCLVLAALAACDRRHESADFLPSAPGFQEALQIVLAALSVPADGASTVRIEAQISPDADPDRRTIRFATNLGGFVDPGSSDPPTASVDRQADVEGKAVAYLQAAKKAGVAVVTVTAVGKDDQGNDVVFATVSAEVEFTQVEDALSLTVTPESAFADGVSAVVLEARVSADAPPEWNQVTFTTSLGVFDNTPGLTTKQVTTDAQRIARVQLTSVQVGTANVSATLVQYQSATVSRLISFGLRNPDAVRISTSAAQVPADGATQVSVFADVADGLASRSVVFTTTGGEFLNPDSGNKQQKTVAADASNRAIARLKADRTIGSVLLTATVKLSDTVEQSDNYEIDFIRALPDFIQLIADPSPASKAADKQTTITAMVSRDVGTVSENTVIDYAVEKSDGSPVTDIEFSDITRVKNEESTAVLFFGDTAETLPLVVVVRASAAGSAATGLVSITLNP